MVGPWQRAEVLRRLVHASGAFIPTLYLLDLLSWPGIQGLFLVGLTIATGLETVRLSIGLDWRIYRTLTREYEQSAPAGYALYFLSSATVVIVFSPPVAIPSLLMLAIGDPVSGLLASGSGRRVKRGPVLAAMFAICLFLALPFVAVEAAVAGAATATVADGVKPVISGHVIDDNLTIPLGAASAIALTAALIP